jgi:hypothetical protein
MATPTAILTDPGFTLTVHVTAQDIADGVRKDCLACPVAIATARTLALAVGGPGVVEASEFSIDVFLPQQRLVRAYAPQSVRQFMVEFDSGYPGVEPFTFDLSFYRTLAALRAS